jgi:hypothetical protein
MVRLSLPIDAVFLPIVGRDTVTRTTLAGTLVYLTAIVSGMTKHIHGLCGNRSDCFRSTGAGCVYATMIPQELNFYHSHATLSLIEVVS